MSSSPMADRLFFLERMGFEQIKSFAARLGYPVTDTRWRVPRIAVELARKRTLGLDKILAALDLEQLATACQRLGLPDADDALTCRRTILDALDRTPLRELTRAVAHQHHDLVAVPATLVRVVDGDTIVVTMEGAEKTVRIRGIDAPESSTWSDKAEADLDRARMDPAALQALGEAATRWLTERLRGHALILHCQPTPASPLKYLHHRQHRLLAYVTLDAPDGLDVGEALLREGFGLVWPRNFQTRRYLHPRSERYVMACNGALAHQPGLWNDGLARLCPRAEKPSRAWTLDACKDCCFRSDWRSPGSDGR